MKILELGHVVLYVSDLAKMADFYAKTLGFNEIIREWPIAAFSGGRTHHELLLIEVGGASEHQARGRAQKPGLYHIGFKVGDSPEELKKVYKELKMANVRIVGSSDHGVTHSLYILDPDGNELELYADVSDEWKKNPKAIATPARPLNLE
jgi:catechol-2,3-dioxygenase